MPFPQLPSSKDIADGFKGMMIMIAVMIGLSLAYGIYQEVTTEKKPYVSPQDQFKNCVASGKSQDICLVEFEDRVSR